MLTNWPKVAVILVLNTGEDVYIPMELKLKKKSVQGILITYILFIQ